MLTKNEQKIVDLLDAEEALSSSEIFDHLNLNSSFTTLKRTLSKLVNRNFLGKSGKGRATKYSISAIFKLLKPMEMDLYFDKEIDERHIQNQFNFEIIEEVLVYHSLFNDKELKHLNALQAQYRRKISELSESAFSLELERLGIDLSWKSSQIEGNTYTLLETERLLKDKETAKGKTKEEATMLLNHKTSLNLLIETPDYLNPLSVLKIENIHHLLTKDLNIDRNLRKSRVGISGTNYRPLDNEFQIKEALRKMCDLINAKENVFEKALLSLVLISYIQPFIDGNKRTARIVSNAILMDAKYCPLSFRTVDSIDYKKAMLIFYEQNNISNFKKIFIDQFEFAVDTYF